MKINIHYVFCALCLGCIILIGSILLGVSTIAIQRMIGKHLYPYYNPELIQSRTNSSSLYTIKQMDEKGNIITNTGTIFDTRWDILFYTNPQENNINYKNLSGGRQMFALPKTFSRIGISVCTFGVFDCSTQWYSSSQCLKLIYVPRYLHRKRDEVMTGCQMVDISRDDRDSLYFSVH